MKVLKKNTARGDATITTAKSHIQNKKQESVHSLECSRAASHRFKLKWHRMALAKCYNLRQHQEF